MQYQYTPANSSGKSLDIFDTSRTRHSAFRQVAKLLYHSDIVLSSSYLRAINANRSGHSRHLPGSCSLPTSTWPITPACEARP